MANTGSASKDSNLGRSNHSFVKKLTEKRINTVKICQKSVKICQEICPKKLHLQSVKKSVQKSS